MEPTVYDTTNITSPQNGSNPQPGTCHTLSKGQHAPLLVQPTAFTQNQAGDVLTGTVMHSLATNGNSTGRNAPNVCYGISANVIGRADSSGGNQATGVKEEEAPTLTKADRHAVAICEDTSDTIVKNNNQLTGAQGYFAAQQSDTTATVRRLTPMECERLQGFPDGWTNVPGASDSKRYAALGNSMTTNVMHWLGSRIDAVDKEMAKIELL
jgi:DNA (cytosine-5)-methyltransferase 1